MAFDHQDFEIEAPAEVDEVGQIILKARKLLSDPAKWCKSEMERGDGAFCILGAMCATGSLSTRHHYKAVDRIREALPRGKFFSVILFNTAPKPPTPMSLPSSTKQRGRNDQHHPRGFPSCRPQPRLRIPS